MSRLKRIVAGCAAALILVGAWALVAADGRAALGPSAAASNAPKMTRSRYVCPMHPQIVQDHPGRCPICGMDLVKAQEGLHEDGVQVDAAALSALGVARISARQQTVAEPLRTFGTVVPDETASYTVDTKFDGWLRKLYVHAPGERVREGQVLYEIHSPDLVAKQREYFRFLTRRKQVLQTVGDVSQQENEYVMDLLREWQKEREELMRQDLDIDTIRQLEDTGTTIEVVKIRARRSGVITQLNAREGSFVTPAQPIATIADPQSLWIDITLPAGQLERIERGDPVTVKDAAGATAHARIDFISSLADGGRGHARAVVTGAGDWLPLGTLVDVTIELKPHTALVLPASAVARTGHGDFVMLDGGEGRFVPVRVTLGTEAAEGVEVVSGVQPDATVASNAQFLLDAAASIEDARDRRSPPEQHAHAM